MYITARAEEPLKSKFHHGRRIFGRVIKGGPRARKWRQLSKATLGRQMTGTGSHSEWLTAKDGMQGGHSSGKRVFSGG